MNFVNQFFSRNYKLNKNKSSPKYELLPFIKLSLSWRKYDTNYFLRKVSKSKSVISGHLDKLLFTGFEGTLDDFYRVYGRKDIIKKIKPKEKLKLDSKLLLKSDISSKPLKLTKLKEFNLTNKIKNQTSFNYYTNKNKIKINFSLDKNKDNVRNKSAFDISTKNNSNIKIDYKTIMKTNRIFDKNIIIKKINKKYKKLLKIKKIRKILNKKSKDILKNICETSSKEKQKKEENNKNERKKEINMKKYFLKHNNSAANINKTFKKYLLLKNSEDDPEDLKKILDPLDREIRSDLKEVQRYDGKEKQNIWMKRSTANLVSFGHSFLIMADESFYKEHKRIIGKYPNLEKEAKLLVLENKSKGDDKLINKMEQNERKINFIIRDSDSILKSIKLKTLKKTNSQPLFLNKN